MVETKYAESYAEVLDIIEHMDEELVDKIPQKFIKFLKENSLKEYEVKFDYSEGLKSVKLKPETSAVMAIIYMNYLCNKESKEEYMKILQENEKKHQDELNEKYSYEKIFDSKQSSIQENTKSNEYETMQDDAQNEIKNDVQNDSQNSLTVIKKENIFVSFFRKIKEFFKLK